jgi:hypothetical protein
MSWAGEVGALHDFFPNSYRFGTEGEAKAFIEKLKESWVPKEFIRTVRVLKSKDPISARWSGRKKEAIRLDVNEIATLVVAAAPDEDEDEAPAALVNEGAYRTDPRSRRRHQRRISREAWRNYVDNSRWFDQEDQVLLSAVLRHDIRHLLVHGHCRYDLSRKLYNGFKAAHDGRAPEDFSYSVGARPDHGACKYGTEETMRKIKNSTHEDGTPAPDWSNFEVTETLVAKSVKKRRVNLKTLKAKSLAKLIVLAEEYEIEDAGLMNKSELLHVITKQSEDSAEDQSVFDLGDGVGGNAMETLIQWLAMPEIRVRYQEDLVAMRDFEEAEIGYTERLLNLPIDTSLYVLDRLKRIRDVVVGAAAHFQIYNVEQFFHVCCIINRHLAIFTKGAKANDRPAA